MLWLQFGEMREVPARGGGTRTFATGPSTFNAPGGFAGRASVVGYHDFYYDLTGKPLDDWDKPGQQSLRSCGCRAPQAV